ncbi:MAG: hypothetical protein ACRC2J_16495, partial [Microcoleaceae cyanobacterium]
LQRALHYQIEVYKKLHPNHQITNNQTPNQITYVTNDTRVVDIDDPDFSQIVKTIRSYYEKLGITGQNQALSKVPSYLLPAIFTLIS